MRPFLSLLLLAIASLFGSHYPTDPTPFHQLPITQKERDKIFKLIDSMGTDSWGSLLLKKRKLEKIGEEIDHIHPIRFLATVFVNPHLRYCMQEISHSPLKWGRFIKGLSKKLEINADKNNLYKYISGFATEVGVDPDRCYRYLHKREWEPFVHYLIQH